MTSSPPTAGDQPASDAEPSGAPATPVDPEERVRRWENRVEIPLLLLALAFVVAYAWTVIDSQMDPTLEAFLRLVSWTTWGAFAIDFVVRLILARRRGRYLIRHWYDVLLVILPMFRALRVLRLIGTLRILNRVFQNRLIGRAGAYIIVIAAICVFFGALALLDAEKGAPGAVITTFGDALWFAFNTATTVGYGEMKPVTGIGRFIAGGLMVVRITLLGAVTATMSAWLVSALRDQQSQRAADEQAESRSEDRASEQGSDQHTCQCAECGRTIAS